MKNEKKDFDIHKAVKQDISAAAALLRLIMESPEIVDFIVNKIAEMEVNHKAEIEKVLKSQINQPKAD